MEKEKKKPKQKKLHWFLVAEKEVNEEAFYRA